MLIKVNGIYLDFDGEVDMEKQVKILEEIDTTSGDYSYEFELPATSHNLSALGNPRPDVSNKSVYQEVRAELQDDDGITLYYGSLYVQQITKETISCDFFSGNYNWISQLTGTLADLDWSQHDTELSESNILNSMVNTSGVNYPVVDTGGLITRGFSQMFVEDFNASMYLKTIFLKVFNSEGIKVKGELLNDWLFNNMVIWTSNKSKSELDAKSCFVKKTTTTNRPTENVPVKMIFQNDSAQPAFNGSDGAWNLSTNTYTAPVAMRVDVEATFVPSIVSSDYNNRIYLYINGAFTFVDVGYDVGGLYNSATPGDRGTFTIRRNIFLDAGDTLEIYTEWQQSLGSTANHVTSGELQITPTFLYYTYGNAIVPKWTKVELVANVLNLFNVVSDFNPYTKEVTFNFFDKINSKAPIDISEYIQVNKYDLSEFISSYGKINTFQYDHGPEEEIKDYNSTEFVKYSEGTLQVNNHHIADSVDVISSKFTSPISYVSNTFACSLERTKMFEFVETESVEFTSVTNSSGSARFVIPHNPFQNLDLIRISECSNPEYNKDWMISSSSSTFIQLLGCEFKSTATGKITGLRHTYADNDAVYLLVNVPFHDVSNFSSLSDIYISEQAYDTLSYGYFNLLNTGKAINTSHRQGLSFGSISHPLSYQRSLLDSYWRNFGKILNDPVKLICTAHFPKAVFRSLTPLTPVYIRSEETTNMYYINRITGYRGSHLACEVELIKL